MFPGPGDLTDRWQLLCTYDPDTGDIKPLNFNDSNWKTQRFEYVDGDMIYKGGHELIGAATSDDSWRIWKYTWDVSSNPILIEGPLVGAWDDRESLGWG